MFHDEFFFFFLPKAFGSCPGGGKKGGHVRLRNFFSIDRAAKDVHTRNEEKALLSFRVAIIPHFINAHKI